MAYDRRDLILALIDAGSGVLPGITRLQKLLFLLEREYDLHPADGAEFQAYRFGPYSRKLYDDLQYLENIGYLETDRQQALDQDVTEMDFGFLAVQPRRYAPSTVSGEELVERERFYLDTFEGRDEQTNAVEGDLGPERRYRLSEKAKKYLDTKFGGPDGVRVLHAAEELKQRFRSLDRLIEYIYTRYPEYTVESEIRDRILGE